MDAYSVVKMSCCPPPASPKRTLGSDNPQEDESSNPPARRHPPQDESARVQTPPNNPPARRHPPQDESARVDEAAGIRLLPPVRLAEPDLRDRPHLYHRRRPEPLLPNIGAGAERGQLVLQRSVVPRRWSAGAPPHPDAQAQEAESRVRLAEVGRRRRLRSREPGRAAAGGVGSIFPTSVL